MRQEKETRISQRDFEQYQQLTGDHFLEKVRYHIRSTDRTTDITDSTDRSTDITDTTDSTDKITDSTDKHNKKNEYTIELDVYT